MCRKLRTFGAQAGENAPWLAGEAMRMASEGFGRFWESAAWAVRRRGRTHEKDGSFGRMDGAHGRPWTVSDSKLGSRTL